MFQKRFSVENDIHFVKLRAKPHITSAGFVPCFLQSKHTRKGFLMASIDRRIDYSDQLLPQIHGM